MSKRLPLAVSLIVIAVSCQLLESPAIDKSQIIGKWVSGFMTLELFDDGGFISAHELKGEKVTGTYELLENNIIRTTSERFGTLDYKASMSEGKLIITGLHDKETAELKRVGRLFK